MGGHEYVSRGTEIPQTMVFGRWPRKPGAEPEDMSWWVIETFDDGTCLLLAKEAVEAWPYADGLKTFDGTWEYSSLRRWMNTGFYRWAFDARERALIMPSILGPAGSAVTLQDAVTYDMVFAPDVSQVEKCAGKPFVVSARSTKYSERRRVDWGLPYWLKSSDAWWMRGQTDDLGKAMVCLGSWAKGRPDQTSAESSGIFARPAIRVASEKVFAIDVERAGHAVADDGLSGESLGCLIRFGASLEAAERLSGSQAKGKRPRVTKRDAREAARGGYVAARAVQDLAEKGLLGSGDMRLLAEAAGIQRNLHLVGYFKGAGVWEDLHRAALAKASIKARDEVGLMRACPLSEDESRDAWDKWKRDERVLARLLPQIQVDAIKPKEALFRVAFSCADQSDVFRLCHTVSAAEVEHKGALLMEAALKLGVPALSCLVDTFGFDAATDREYFLRRVVHHLGGEGLCELLEKIDLDAVRGKETLLRLAAGLLGSRGVRIFEGHPGYFTPARLDKVIMDAQERGDTETVAYLLAQKTELAKGKTGKSLKAFAAPELEL